MHIYIKDIYIYIYKSASIHSHVKLFCCLLFDSILSDQSVLHYSNKWFVVSEIKVTKPLKKSFCVSFQALKENKELSYYRNFKKK